LLAEGNPNQWYIGVPYCTLHTVHNKVSKDISPSLKTVVCEPFPEKAWVAVFFQEEGVHVVGCFVKRVPETKKRLKSGLLFPVFLQGLFAVQSKLVPSDSKRKKSPFTFTYMWYSY
jgi:hypothetical protein